jgi:hypothetical protein
MRRGCQQFNALVQRVTPHVPTAVLRASQLAASSTDIAQTEHANSNEQQYSDRSRDTVSQYCFGIDDFSAA